MTTTPHPQGESVLAVEQEREALVLLIERMCPDKPESNFRHPIGTECEALADAILTRLAYTPREAGLREALLRGARRTLEHFGCISLVARIDAALSTRAKGETTVSKMETVRATPEPTTPGVEALREALAGFVAGLTDAGRNRGSCLSVNHDRLNTRIKQARAALGTGESEA